MTKDILWSDEFATGKQWLESAKALKARLKIPGFPFAFNPTQRAFAFKNDDVNPNLFQKVEMMFAKQTDTSFTTRPGSWSRLRINGDNGWIWFR